MRFLLTIFISFVTADVGSYFRYILLRLLYYIKLFLFFHNNKTSKRCLQLVIVRNVANFDVLTNLRFMLVKKLNNKMTMTLV